MEIKKPLPNYQRQGDINMLLKEFTGRLWENGEFGVSCIKTIGMPNPEVPIYGPEQREHQEWIHNCLQVHSAGITLDYYSQESISLESTSDPNSHREKKRGLNGISAYGRRLVRNAAFRLEKENGMARLSFVTLTLPNVSAGESRDIGRNWSQIVRVFIQKLRRRLQALGLPAEVLAVTEIQTKRTQRDGVLGLHLHMIFVGRHRRTTWALMPKEISAFWQSVLAAYLYEPTGDYDWRAVENVARVRKSASAYLGKYMSKGVSNVVAASEQFGEDAIPTAWYAITSSLRDRTLSRVKLLDNNTCLDLVVAASIESSPFFHYRYPILLSSPGLPDVTIGWHGKLKSSYIEFFTE